jgi:uncharacterized protein YecE (DUF72 family)
MRVLVGTSGFSYKEWKGAFYPEKLKNADMLRYYGERLPTVEVNNTFYRMPKRSMLEGWRAKVPEPFRFVLKASRRITHQARLKDAEDAVQFLFRQANALGDRLGPVLFQLPPFLKKGAQRLSAFLDTVPEGRRVAMEFRHPSWYDDEVFDVLRAHDAALCVSDFEDEEDRDKAAPLVATASVGYLRLRGESYTDEELSRWAQRILEQPWERAYVFFKHEEEAAAPQLALRLMDALGSHAVRPALKPLRKAEPARAEDERKTASGEGETG